MMYNYWKKLNDDEFNELLLWIKNKLNIDNSQIEIIKNIIKKDTSLSDIEINKNIREYLVNINKLIDNSTSSYIGTEVPKYKIKTIYDNIEKMIKTERFDLLIDYGCGNTTYISEELQKKLKIKDLICVDYYSPTCSENASLNKIKTFSTYLRDYKILDSKTIQYLNKFINKSTKILITFLMSSHHIEHFDKLINNFKKLNSNNITIILKEENISEYFNIIVLIHQLYETVFYKIQELKMPSTLYLRSLEELDEIIKNRIDKIDINEKRNKIFYLKYQLK